MNKSSAETVANFLLDFLPGLLPKPLDGAAKTAVSAFKSQLDALLSQPRLKRELLEAAQGAETDFREVAKKKFQNDDLVQAVASFPVFDNELFQASLRTLPEHLTEEFLSKDLEQIISSDWKGKFSPEELREGAASYLNCLRKRLLKVEGYADIVTRLAVLRTDNRTEQILAIVQELLKLVTALLERGEVPTGIVSVLVTIPPPVIDFTGREDELKRLKDSFSNGAIITGVSGGGGIGKTELARKLAQEIADDYPDARMSIDLLGTTENPLAPEEALRRLLEPFYPNQKLPDKPEQLKGLFQQTFAAKKSLLLLDNAANAAQVRLLIPPRPSAAIVTSRQYFSLTEFGLQEPLRLDVLSEEESLQLLHTASAKLNNVLGEEVNALAGLCGYLPLALRVVASLLNDRPDWTVNSLLTRLSDERTRLQRLKRQDDLDVEAILNLSYQNLDDELKLLFRQLGVFVIPFIKHSASAVWNIGNDEDVDNSLGKLIARSLVNVTPSPFGVSSIGEVVFLYYLHDLTRVFAMNCLLELEQEARDTILRLGDHLLEWASVTNLLYQQGKENIASALTNFRLIWPQLIVTWERMLPSSKTWPRPQSADSWLVKFPENCGRMLELCVPIHQRIMILHVELDAIRTQKEDSSDLKEDMSLEENYMPADAVILNNLGNSYAEAGESKKALSYLEEALSVLESKGNKASRGSKYLMEKIIGNMGNAHMGLKDFPKALEFYHQQLANAREIGDKEGEVTAIGNMGNAMFRLGDFPSAIKYYEDQLAKARESGDRQAEGDALGNMGTTIAQIDKPDKAVQYLEQAINIAHEMGDGLREGTRLSSLGLRYSSAKDNTNAIRVLGNALSLARSTGHRNLEADVLINLAGVYRKISDKNKVKELLNSALELYKSLGDLESGRLENWLFEFEEKKSIENLHEFIHIVISASRNRSADANSYFSFTSRMSRDSTVPIETRELAKVLRNILAGVKTPDLLALPEELAKLVTDELEQ